MGRGHAFTLSFRASGVSLYAGVVFRVIMIAGMMALADRDSAAWNLGRGRGVALYECDTDVAITLLQPSGGSCVVIAMVICKRK